jgi:hypothetical protein
MIKDILFPPLSSSIKKEIIYNRKMMKVMVKRTPERGELSTPLRISLIVVGTIVIVYSILLASMTKISEALFKNEFIYRESPRDEFLIVSRNKFNWKMVKRGEVIAKSKLRLLVVSPVRNCSKSVSCMERKIRVLSSVFKSVHVAFFENNSTDNTRKLLLEYTSMGTRKMGGDNVTTSVINPFTLVENEPECKADNQEFQNNDKAGIRGATSGRIGRMVYLRNKILDYVYQHQSEYDTLLMTDMDIIGRIFPTGIKETVGYLRSTKDIGFVSFRGFFPTGGFFDPFSYRSHNPLSQTKITTLLLCMIGYFTMPSGEGLQPVSSSHSGGIFANLPLSPQLRYSVDHVVTIPFVTDVNLCEHITLMEKVPNNFVNTNMSFLVKDNV